jgi:pimeloyl-ACP methyl ester carboxylesterase
MTVTMARMLAGLGFTSLRLDISGIGDSDAPPGRLDDPTVEVSSAIDGLRDMGYETFILIGLCSGAKLALETTLRDDRVVGQILLNLQCYWKAPDASTGYMSRQAYFRMARQLSTWKRVARGGVDIRGITMSIVQRSAKAAAHNVAETWGKFRQKDSVRTGGIAQFRSLAARGVQTRFVFVEEDPGLDELQIVFGRGGDMLRSVPNLSITILDEGDHIFSWDCSRKHLMALVEQTLTTMVAPIAADSPTVEA